MKHCAYYCSIFVFATKGHNSETCFIFKRLRGLRSSMGNPIFIHERLAIKDVIIEKKARELDIRYKIKKSHLWAFDGERYQPVDDISELPDYQRRQQKSLQTVQMVLHS